MKSLNGKCLGTCPSPLKPSFRLLVWEVRNQERFNGRRSERNLNRLSDFILHPSSFVLSFSFILHPFSNSPC